MGWDQTSDVQPSYLPYMHSVLCVHNQEEVGSGHARLVLARRLLHEAVGVW